MPRARSGPFRRHPSNARSRADVTAVHPRRRPGVARSGRPSSAVHAELADARRRAGVPSTRFTPAPFVHAHSVRCVPRGTRGILPFERKGNNGSHENSIWFAARWTCSSSRPWPGDRAMATPSRASSARRVMRRFSSRKARCTRRSGGSRARSSSRPSGDFRENNRKARFYRLTPAGRRHLRRDRGRGRPMRRGRGESPRRQPVAPSR